MKKCKLCGSYAINPGHNGRGGDNPNLCEVHYVIAQRDELLAALRQFAECDLNEGNCASLEVATRRIRSIARAAIDHARCV